MRIFVTGSAGFVGFHLARRLLDDGHAVVGFDALTPYYDVRLKRARHAILKERAGFTAVEGHLEDAALLQASLAEAKAEVIVHLAAQPGVRYSLEHPQSYVSSNLVGTLNLLEAARAHRPQHLMFASTSSVYGGNEKVPFSETDRTDSQVSLYAATKRGGEAMTHSYAHLFRIPTTCFRFFTVYGPWGRPDMALFKFVDAIESGRPIEVYGQGQMQRDFTYIDDLIEAVVRLMGVAPEQGKPVGPLDSLSPVAPWRSVNIAGGRTEELTRFIEIIENHLGRSATKIMLPMQKGDVVQTLADPSLLRALIGAIAHTELSQGVGAFVEWYRRDMIRITADDRDA